MDFGTPLDFAQKLPPFGRVLLAYQQESVRLARPIWIYVGKEAKEEAYANKQAGYLCMFLPTHEDVGRYKWPIKNQHVIVYDTGSMTDLALKKVCFQLLSYEPRIIYLWSRDHYCQFFKRN